MSENKFLGVQGKNSFLWTTRQKLKLKVCYCCGILYCFFLISEIVEDFEVLKVYKLFTRSSHC